MTSEGLSPEDIDRGIAENIALGYIELAGMSADGDPTYRLTAAGNARAELLLADAAAADAYDEQRLADAADEDPTP